MLTLLFACATDTGPSEDVGQEQLPGDTSPDSASPDSGDTGESGDTSEDTAACGDVVPDEGAFAALFDASVLHTTTITMSEDARAALAAAPDSWAPASLTLDGAELASIGVKWRGDSAAMRWDGKPSWSIGFRKGEACDTLGGMERITLDAMTDDPVQGRIVVEMLLLQALGRLVPRAAFSTLTVDGEPFGLYALAEYVDANFTTNHLGSWAGVVWKGGSGADFTTAGLAAWDDANGAGDPARLAAVAEIVQGAGDTFYADLGSVLSTPDLAAHWAALAAVGDEGTFPYETDDANLLVPDVGQILLVPDPPESGWSETFDWRHVDSALGVRCVYDEACSAAITDALASAAAALSLADGGAVAEGAFAVSAAAMADDPRRSSTVGAVSASRAALSATIAAWPTTLAASVP
ncbi:hypothetical protein LBMAG42_37060 [Deltaproteobacteria bacterium]|nr:hypothetical protein LBMAG42_37060 [Deltaproteobacteria bacterium]